ncbi:hypothetical protein NUU61_009535 [Penicillium alfredii]|uniref:Sulfatase N-terminal domain-containing protein n=1 Tax=Penicillium alfredii TaxID=1506179 RepID=A0A9W9ENJ9_9EURO|nr:uncharacterized protein NUU61_009535 [Penicillium alfredii]KAJ5084956.1 hypothetical protein NUU61_009535 [Penicillium alfredii]
MKFSPDRPTLTERFVTWVEESAVSAFIVARSPQVYLDRGWEASRSFFFSVISISLILSKCFHLCVHLASLAVPSLLPWGPTFFLVDIMLILVACFLTRSFEWRIGRNVAAVITVTFGLYVSSMTSANISFYVHRGTEMYERGSKRTSHSPAAQTVVSALTVAILVDALIMIGAYLVKPHLFRATNLFLEIWGSLLFSPFGCCRQQKSLLDPETYEQIAIDDYEEGHNDNDSMSQMEPPEISPSRSDGRCNACSPYRVAQSSLIRPRNAEYSYVSESLPFAPFAGLEQQRAPKGAAPSAVTSASANDTSTGANSTPVSTTTAAATFATDFSWLDGHTALDTFPEFDWLPSHNSSEGWPEWSPFRINKDEDPDYVYDHYNPQKDPLRLPNLEGDILEPLRGAIRNGDVKIKHVFLVKLESTRQDVWPLRTSSPIMTLIKDSYPKGKIPKEVEDKLAELTPVAERLTGHKTGFDTDQDRPKPYGGISTTNAWTGSAYSLKSLTASICGVDSIGTWMNKEYKHDIYQPCLPHIFEALSEQPNITTETDDWTSWPWHSIYFQASDTSWDHHYDLNPVLGYQEITVKETIDEDGAKWIPEESEEDKKHSHLDKSLHEYIRNALADAEENNSRLFMTMLTHNPHHPFYMPGKHEEFFGDEGENGKRSPLNRYLNTIHYQNEWISDVLEIIKDAGIANETLFIMAGDHGLSLPNDGGQTAHGSPHVANFEVPLYFSHPKLPQIQLTDAVHSTQILPTILDLLIETSSLDKQSNKIVKDLLPLYQGQSILRPLVAEHNGTRQWHVTTTNQGNDWVGLRSAPDPYRLIAPLHRDAKWRFTDLHADPLELKPLEHYQALHLMDMVEKEHGVEAAAWVHVAARVATWWMWDNHRRWKFDPGNPEND